MLFSTPTVSFCCCCNFVVHAAVFYYNRLLLVVLDGGGVISGGVLVVVVAVLLSFMFFLLLGEFLVILVITVVAVLLLLRLAPVRVVPVVVLVLFPLHAMPHPGNQDKLRYSRSNTSATYVKPKNPLTLLGCCRCFVHDLRTSVTNVADVFKAVIQFMHSCNLLVLLFMLSSTFQRLLCSCSCHLDLSLRWVCR